MSRAFGVLTLGPGALFYTGAQLSLLPNPLLVCTHNALGLSTVTPLLRKNLRHYYVTSCSK